MRLPILPRALLSAFVAAMPFAAQAAPTLGPTLDCARADQPVEAAVCADPALTAMDRMLDRAYRLALEGLPAKQAVMMRADRSRWLRDRADAFGQTGGGQAGGDPAALADLYDRQLRAVIGKAAMHVLPAAIAVARPIDPLANAGPEAEEDAAFVAYVLTTLQPESASPGAGGEAEVLSPYDRYAGFTFIGTLPDGRLFVAVPEDCGAYQCAVTPFVLDRAAGTVARLAVEVETERLRPPRKDPNAHPLGIPSMHRTGVELFELARGSGDCGVKWRYAVDGTDMRLVEALEKPACDGREWGGPGTTARSIARPVQ